LRAVSLLSHIEVVVHGLCQVTDQRIGDIPDVGDRMVGVNGKHKISARRVHDAGVGFIRGLRHRWPGSHVYAHKGPRFPVHRPGLHEPEFVLRHEVDHQLQVAG